MGCQACSGIEQRLRFPQIERIETFGEPAVDRSKQFARLLHLALVTPEAREARSDALGGQQRRGDGCPFRRKITGCRRAACLPIPIIGIVEIALNAVQVSVNPCAVRASPSATIWCALFQSSLPAHQSATNAAKSPSGGLHLARLCWKSDGVMIGFWTCKPRLSVDRSRTCRAHHLVLRPGGARAADRANELAVLD
jgi:hypothetical protein